MKAKGRLVSKVPEVDKVVAVFEFESEPPYAVGDFYEDHDGTLYVVMEIYVTHFGGGRMPYQIEAARFASLKPNPLISSQP